MRASFLSLLLIFFISFLATNLFVRESFAQTPRTRPAPVPVKEADTDEDETPEDEEGEGDPFKRYEKSTLKDQNCDPTILAQFYKKYSYLSCLVTPSGICLNPSKDELIWAGFGAASGGWKGVSSAYKELRLLDASARQSATAVSEAAARGGAQALTKPLLLHAGERNTARAMGGIIVRRGAIGAGLGFLAGGAFGAAWLAADISLTYGISPTACAEVSENDPNLRKYVPIQKGTCHTPIYNAGAPQVLNFMKLPLEEKLKALNGNRRICGFYRSMNEEMEVHIRQLEGGSAVGQVTCDAATGDIKFKVRNNATRTYTIKRKPGTKELRSFSYREHLTPNQVTGGADFELVKTEFGTDLSKIHILNSGISTQTRIVMYEAYPNFSREEPGRSQTILHAFRTARLQAPALMKCCDLSPGDFAKKENRESCPAEWFPPREVIVPLPPARPRSLR